MLSLGTHTHFSEVTGFSDMPVSGLVSNLSEKFQNGNSLEDLWHFTPNSRGPASVRVSWILSQV
jgi:hypothetical protein